MTALGQPGKFDMSSTSGVMRLAVLIRAPHLLRRLGCLDAFRERSSPEPSRCGGVERRGVVRNGEDIGVRPMLAQYGQTSAETYPLSGRIIPAYKGS